MNKANLCQAQSIGSAWYCRYNNMKLRDQIIEKEKDLLSAEVRGSLKKLKELLSEEFREIGASGSVFGLKEVLERLPQAENWSAQVSGFEFRLLTDEIIQLTYRALIKHNAKEAGAYSIRTSIWRHESGSWKLVFHQGTKVPPF